MTNSPTNTSDPDEVRGFFMESLVTGSERAIYAQEAAGQRELVNSEVLPSDLRGPQADWEALGFVFGDPVPNDPLFRKVTLPKGWSRRGTEHSMWSEIVDERGIARVGVFYKAAFYDRKADMHIQNVGATFAANWIYGDKRADPSLLGKLTDAEREQARLRVEQYVRDAEAHPQIYGDRLPLARSLMEALGA